MVCFCDEWPSERIMRALARGGEKTGWKREMCSPFAVH